MLLATDFQRIGRSAGLVDRSDRVRLALTGPDRAKFLHNLTTNDIKRLPEDSGCEAFITSPQGKIISYITVHVTEGQILVGLDPGAGTAAVAHLQKYGVFDDVAIDDQSAATFEYHLAGPASAALIHRAGGRLPEDADHSQVLTDLEGFPVRVIRESPTVFSGFTLIGQEPSSSAVRQIFVRNSRDHDLVMVDPESFEVLRIEAGTPVFGKDITEKNLPQEIGRDDRAISFVKGCYLGQETVARIDALGHVNQILKGLRFARQAPCPQAGSPLESADKRVGVVTSVAFAPLLEAPIALGLIRTTHARAGTELSVRSADGAALASCTVSDLPMSSIA
jgi:folate-binding protein YgfZ